MEDKKGSLIVVGTGIRAIGHITLEAMGAIREADKVFYVVADHLTNNWIRKQNENSDDLYVLYGDDKQRIQTYNEMTDHVVKAVRSGLKVSLVFYGHPGIFVNPSHRAISILRSEGYNAEMFPGISTIDCLFADLGIDPSKTGLQMYDATNLLMRKRHVDTTCCVVILQIACVGDPGFCMKGYDCRHMPKLLDYLESFYGTDHEVVLYEAAQYAVSPPTIEIMRLDDVRRAKVTGISTLFIPPKDEAEVDKELADLLNSETTVKSKEN